MNVIRYAQFDDIEQLLDLGEAMHAESRYARYAWDRNKVGRLIHALIESPDGFAVVAVHDGTIVGGFLGSLDEHFFSPQKIASDYALFVLPAFRGGMTAGLLVEAFIAWARELGVTPHVGVTTGVNLEGTTKLYQGLGFEPVGTLFEYVGAGHA